jgi:hypothetical protein
MFGAGSYVDDINVIKNYAFNSATLPNSVAFWEVPPDDNLKFPIF